MALRSILSVPLRAQDAVIGTLQAVDSRVGRFGPADLAVLEPLAASAAIAIQNARLFEQAQHEIAERKRAEQEIRKLNQYLGGIIENANIWLNVLDANANVVMWNTAAEEISGYSREEVVGHARIWEWLYPDQAYRDQVFGAAVAIIQEGQEEQDSDTTIRCRDGRTRIISWNSRRLLDERGAPMGSIALGRDITERRRAEEEIHRRNQELALLNRVIAASAGEPEPVAILETACRELAAAFDLPQAAAALLNQDKTAAVVVAEYLAEGRPSAMQGIIPVTDNPSFHYLLSRKAPLVVEDAQHDPRLAPLHEALRERGTVSLLMLPLVAEGEVLGSLGLDAGQPRRFSAEEVSLAWSVADQAAGALARARLAQAHLRLSAAVEQAAESIAITDTQGTILYVNPAFEHTTGYRAAEVLGQTPHFLKSEQQEAAFYERRWKTIQAGQTWHARLSIRRKDGTLYTADESVTPIRDEGGAIVNYVSLHRDVTSALQLEEQYRQAQKMEAVGQLTAGIAHDFNNLLTAINGFAELLQFELAPGDPRQELAARVLGSGRRAADLVRQLLAFSRKQIIQPQVLDLNAAVADLDKLLGRIIGEHITLQTVPAPGLWPVKMDPAQIEQVVVNLAVNARDAMPGGGRLTIETANTVLDEAYAASHLGVAPGEYVLLTISDTGVGMSAEVQAHLFEPFFTTKGPGKGTGLGLATVYGIVKQSGGHIWVYSEEGRGSAFKIYLPRVETDAASQLRLEGGRQAPSGQETILLVEDNPEVRDLARQVLARQGYTVLEAAEGEEALRRAEAHAGPIHLLLTDVVMPGMTGKALAERLGALRPDLKVLYMSGYTDETIAHHGVLEPGVAFLQKPFTSFNLALKVRQVLNQTRPAQPA
jgi:PAS domain S-box-containing protein